MPKEELVRVVIQSGVRIGGEHVSEHTVVAVPQLLALELLESNKAVPATPESEARAKNAIAAAEKAAKAAPEKR